MNQKQEDKLDAIIDFCQDRLKSVENDISELTVPEQVVITIYSAQGLIDNGGFQYFFENDFPNKPNYRTFIKAYTEIGAKIEANSLKKAVSMFGFSDPHLDVGKRRNFLDKLDDEADFFDLEDDICGNEAIWEKLVKYAIQHIEIK